MRRLTAVIALVFLASCQQRETREASSANPTRPATPATATAAAPPPVVVQPKLPSRSTPAACAGDGSYEQAVDCLRMAGSLRFTFDEGSGQLKRPTPGKERVTFDVTRGDARGSWVAESRPSGVVWTHGGKPAAAVPSQLERLYQRLTIFPDPQKKEGHPQVASRDSEAVHYTFTDANSGDTYEVVVSAKDGAIERVMTRGSTIAFSR